MDYERVHMVKPEVFVYRIPPLQTNKAARAADWKLDAPDWTGRLRLTSLSKQLFIKLEDKASGDLFAKAPIYKHPGIAVQPVSDSSRYFVVRLMDDGGRSAFIGLGFADRGDSFDFNVALQDYFKDLDRDSRQEQDAGRLDQQPALNLAFKEGQTIRINLGKKEDGTPVQPRPRPASSTAGGAIPFLPPPPSGVVRVSNGSNRATPTTVGDANSNPFPQATPQTNPFLATSQPTPPVGGAGDLFGQDASVPPAQPTNSTGVAVDNLLDL